MEFFDSEETPTIELDGETLANLCSMNIAEDASNDPIILGLAKRLLNGDETSLKEDRRSFIAAMQEQGYISRNCSVLGSAAISGTLNACQQRMTGNN